MQQYELAMEKNAKSSLWNKVATENDNMIKEKVNVF